MQDICLNTYIFKHTHTHIHALVVLTQNVMSRKLLHGIQPTQIFYVRSEEEN